MDTQSPDAESEAAFSHPAEDRSDTPYSPTAPPLIDESPRIPQRPTLQVSRYGGSGSQLIGASQSSRARPGTGSTTPSPPAGIITSETVPPQLLGRRLATDADSFAESVKRYQTGQIASATAQIRSLRAPILPPDPPASFAVSRAPAFEEGGKFSRSSSFERNEKAKLPSIPLSDLSDPSSDESATSSALSYASSFAYGLQRARPDTRLLKKSSKPLQHTRSKRSMAQKPAAIVRSPSSLAPRVVEDWGIVQPTTAEIVAVPERQPIDLKLPESFNKPKPIRRVHTFAPLPRPKPILRPSELKTSRSIADAVPHGSGATSPTTSHSSRQLRLRGHAMAESVSSESLNVPPATPPKDRSKRQSWVANSISTFNRLELSFQTLLPENTGDNEFKPMRTPPLAESKPVTERPSVSKVKFSSGFTPESSPAASLAKTPRRPLVATPEPRKSSSIFSFFRKTASYNKVLEDATPKIDSCPSSPSSPNTQSTQTITPGIKVSSPNERDSNVVPDMTIPPYFARPRYQREKSESTLSPSPGVSPGVSPMAMNEDNETPASFDNGRSRWHNRSSSEQLSPMTKARPRMRPRHQPTLEDLNDEAVNREATPPSMRGTLHTARPPGTLSPGPRSEPSTDVTPTSHHSTTGRSEAKFSGLRRLSSTIKRRSEIVKDLVMDLRKSSSVDVLASDRHADARRDSVMHRFSLPRLSMKSSMSTTFRLLRQTTVLSRVAENKEDCGDDNEQSHAINEAQVPQPVLHPPKRKFTAAELEVTNFYQTPFRQRYYDSERAYQQQIQAFLDEDMDEDNEEDDEIVLGFERNVPDHFPNSPLCPLNPKHKSGGKAICPMHRRYRKSIANRLIRVGPVRSRRVISLSTLSQQPPEYRPEASGQTGNCQIVFDTREDGKGDVRTNSLGSDGAGIPPSPSSGEHSSGGRESVQMDVLEVKERCLGKKVSESDLRGRRRKRAECGSDRKTRRNRMRRGR